MKDATLLAAKARQSAHGRFLHLTGQHLYFFVRLDEENSEAGMIVGREDNGMVVAEFGLRGNRISENLVQRFCASVDAGRFEPE
jgi:hypothetical protein